MILEGKILLDNKQRSWIFIGSRKTKTGKYEAVFVRLGRSTPYAPRLLKYIEVFKSTTSSVVRKKFPGVTI